MALAVFAAKCATAVGLVADAEVQAAAKHTHINIEAMRVLLEFHFQISVLKDGKYRPLHL